MGSHIPVQNNVVQMQGSPRCDTEQVLAVAGGFRQSKNIREKTAYGNVTADFQLFCNRDVGRQLNGRVCSGKRCRKFGFIGNLCHRISPFFT